jgi:hypothetical protein
VALATTPSESADPAEVARVYPFAACKEIRMPHWKALFIMAFGILCLALALGAFLAPLALTNEEHRWLWCAGLFVATVFMGTLFVLFLRSADRAFMGADPRKSH